MPLALGAEESVHAVSCKLARANAMAFKKLVPVERGRVAGPWRVSFQPGRGAPARATFADVAPLGRSADAGIQYFSGIATYASHFASPQGWKLGQPLWRDLGEAREVAEVIANGKSAGNAWRMPYQVDVGGAARAWPQHDRAWGGEPAGQSIA